MLKLTLGSLLFLGLILGSWGYRSHNSQSSRWKKPWWRNRNRPRTMTHYPPPGLYHGPKTPQDMTSEALDDVVARLEMDELTGRIVFGRQASPGETPYQLQLTINNPFKKKRIVAWCGAVLVEVYDVQIALTAAHCIWRGSPSRFDTFPLSWLRLIAGDHNNNITERTEQVRNPAKIVYHDRYNMDANHPTHDIAIVFFKRPFTYNTFVSPIALPEYGWEVPARGLVSGFGSISTQRPWQYDGLLRVTWLDSITQSRCKLFENPAGPFTWRQFCMLGRGESTCYGDDLIIFSYRLIIKRFKNHMIVLLLIGDSGGPVAARNTSLEGVVHGTYKWYLAGITSYGTSKLD
ncbi:unnamed protein product [Orchesella dallaii]|uniref:Peptidase S1 domain-containing protein n=1 Tax=Orchesella dallaii TaxID=48710 RepID=A0ABP1PM16_9HEXA